MFVIMIIAFVIFHKEKAIFIIFCMQINNEKGMLIADYNQVHKLVNQNDFVDTAVIAY